jgi:hypothetical protein
VIVRELLTLLGFTVDKASYDQAAKQYDALTGKIVDQSAAVAKQTQAAAKGTGALGQALGMVQRFVAAAGISTLLKQYTTLASDANETRGALTQLFGPDAIGEVDAWSERMGVAMGRSKYDLQAYAARLGSVLGPVTENQEQAQEMAQSLAELSVDLASFFNTKDEDAMAALRSGLTGEMESLKRYGIVVNEATLQEVAHKQGLKKKVSQMTVAEKTQLRYAAILEASSAAQGDAIRTSEGFANSSKALKAELKTLGIDAAKKVLPVLERFTRWGRDALKAFNQMAKESNVLEAAMWTLAAVAGVLALEFYGAFILPALAIGVLILLVDELITTFRGGNTLITEFINSFAGAGAAQEWVLNLTAGFQILGEEMSNSWALFMAEWGNASAWDAVTGTLLTRLSDWSDRLGDWAASIADVLLWPFRKVQEVLKGMGIETGPEIQEQSYTRAAGRDLAAREQTSDETLWQRYQERIARANAGTAAPNLRGDMATGLRMRQFAAARGLAAGAGIGGTPSTTAAPAAVVAPGGAAAPAEGGPPAVLVPVATAAPVINIHGGDPAAVERVVKRALADDRKAQIAAAGGRGRS